MFKNPFCIEDLAVFDDAAMQRLFSSENSSLSLEDLACSMHSAPSQLIERITSNLAPAQHSHFLEVLQRPLVSSEVQAARRRVLDSLFWDLVYWKMPEAYDELTEGEELHPGIFQQLEPDVRGRTVLDAGAGSGRATFECLRYGASLVYAVEPSPGLLRILERKLASRSVTGRVTLYRGTFSAIPLPDRCVDLALSCSAFTAEPAQGGEPGLAELKRVTKPGGKIVIIWPRRQDYAWLTMHGFHHVVLPIQHEMMLRFRSVESAWRCVGLFYARNNAVVQYILERQQPEIPFSVLGVNPPCDYCWLAVE